MNRSISVRLARLRQEHSGLVQMLVVAGLSVLVLAAMIVARSLVAPAYFFPFVAVAGFVAWMYGLRAGIAATLLGAALVEFFFLRALGAWWPEPGDWFRIGAFVAGSMLLCVLIDRLARTSERMTAALSGLADGVILSNRAGCVVYANPAAEALLGVEERELIGRRAADLLSFREEKGATPVPLDIAKALKEGVALHTTGSVSLGSRRGDEAWLEANVAPIRNAAGRMRGAVIVLRDVTKPRQMQSRLTQSEKMEAVARLAGGVAGDFNNLLTVITGYGEMIRSDLAAGDPLRRFADEILYSAERAAGLARQLLAFSRGQSGMPRPVNFNELFAGMETMLKRLLGGTIEIVLLPGPGLGLVNADPAQLEQMMVNLAMNSRDAMPNGGRFVIETGNVELADPASAKRAGVPAGNYVMLAVSDTGCGMDGDTQARLFEPFFTTKVQGKGAGLGLSVVYGTVQQSNGHISVYSQPGAGTIFEFYFPRAKETAEPVHGTKGRGPRGSETILVADDEDSVRRLVIAVLATHGYTILEASGGREALDVYESNPDAIDMVIIDVVMPEMNGYEFVRRVLVGSPRVKVLYMSGFRGGNLTAPETERQRPFLSKPFTPNTLLTTVREVLDGKGGSSLEK